MILSALEQAKTYFKHRDFMNGAVHCEKVRLSPITLHIQEATGIQNGIVADMRAKRRK